MPTKALGRVIDICSGVVPVADLAAGAQTGHRVHMRQYGGLIVVGFMGAVSAGTDTFVPDVQQHDAATSGNTQDLDTVTEWYVKNETTLDGDEAWTRVTQSAGSEISLTGATYAAQQLIVAAEILSSQLADGYEWVSVAMADPGAGGTRAGCFFYLPFDLVVQKRPDRLDQPNL